MNTSMLLMPLAIILSAYVNCCTNRDRSAQEQIVAIETTFHVPIVNWDGGITNIDKAYKVYYFNDYLTYSSSYQYDSNVNGKNLLSERRTRFLVFRRDSTYGYMYYPEGNRLPAERVLVDSILRVITFRENNMDTLLNFTPDSVYTNENRDLVKVYTLSSSTQGPESATYYFYYTSELKDIAETFTKRMDNEKDRKLFKVRLVAHGGYYPQFRMSFPEREMIYEMKRIPIGNPAEILAYFNRYKKEHSQR